MASVPQTPEEIFDQAKGLHADMNCIDDFKNSLASFNSSTGIIRSIFPNSASNVSPDTELALNEAILSALNNLFDTNKATLQSQFNNLFSTQS